MPARPAAIGSIGSTAIIWCTASARPPSRRPRARCASCAGKGAYVWDSEGRRYLDGLSSLWNVAVGHGRRRDRARRRGADPRPRVRADAARLLDRAGHPPGRAHRAHGAEGPAHVMFTSGGSESNESVIRLVRLYWRLRGRADKIGIVALRNAYHGTSSGAASLTGLAGFHRYYEPQLPEVSRIPRPYCYRCELGKTYPACGLACADELEAVIAREGAERIGAVIAEPVQGVGGVVVPPPGWFERIRAICDRHDLLLVVDEVITGFGRLGKRVRHPALEGDPRPAGVRQGGDERLPAARRRHPARSRLADARRRRSRVRLAPRLHLLRPSGRLCGRAREPRHHRARGPDRRGAPQGAVLQATGGDAWRPCRSSARCAPSG